jgi:hypothetical protein
MQKSRTLFSSIAPIKANKAFFSIVGRGDATYGEYSFIVLEIYALNKHTSHRISVLNPSLELI